jgi:hypothetical protein
VGPLAGAPVERAGPLVGHQSGERPRPSEDAPAGGRRALLT